MSLPTHTGNTSTDDDFHEDAVHEKVCSAKLAGTDLSRVQGKEGIRLVSTTKCVSELQCFCYFSSHVTAADTQASVGLAVDPTNEVSFGTQAHGVRSFRSF